MNQRNILKFLLIISIIITGMAFADKSYSLPVINEVAAKANDENGATLPDWIELYNPADTSADIGAWILKDSDDTHEYVFPVGTVISSKQYLVVKKDETGFDFGLGSEDSVRFFDNSSNLVDQTAWSDGDAPENKTWGRIPNGSGQFKTLNTPTQGQENADNILTLADAVTGLKIMAGLPVSSDIDINNDGKTGLREVIYIIRELSGPSFSVRQPQNRTIDCCGDSRDYWDIDTVCHFQYGSIDAEIYVQATPTTCPYCPGWGIAAYDTEAWIKRDETISKFDAVYDFGGGHHNDSITFELEGKEFKLYHSSFGFGWRSCYSPDCMQVGDEDGCQRQACSDRPALPVACMRVQADGTVPELVNPWEEQGYEDIPALPCLGDSLCQNSETKDILVNISGNDGTPPDSFQVILDTNEKVISGYCENGTSSDDNVICTETGVKLTSVQDATGIVVKAKGYHTAQSDLSQYTKTGASQEISVDIALNPLSSFQKTADYQTGFTEISGYSDFKSLAVQYPTEIGTSLVVKFYIDSLDKEEPRVFFQNTLKYPLHYVFARNALGIPLSLQEFEIRTYHGEDRTGMAGSVIIYPDLQIEAGSLEEKAGAPVTINFFPSDDLSPELALKAYRLIEERMLFLSHRGSHNRLFYLPAADTHDTQMNNSQKKFLSAGALWMHREELYGSVKIQYLNKGLAYGTLRVMTPEELETTPVSFKDILVLTRLANDLPIVGGTVTEELQTPLAHVNVAARTRGTPNMAMLGASSDERVKPYLNKLVRLEVMQGNFTLQETTLEDAEDFWDSLIPDQTFYPPSDSNREGLFLFSDLSFNDSIAVGVKAANLAELSRLLNGLAKAPDGFAVPFRYYNDFMSDKKGSAELCEGARTDCTEEGRDQALCKTVSDICTSSANAGDTLKDYVTGLLKSEPFKTDSGIREACLDGLKYLIHHIPVDDDFGKLLDSQVSEMFGTKNVRLRSSTNAEDLTNFSGAGLYRSVSAAIGTEDPPSSRIRKVWASVWNFKAFEERSFWNIDHESVRMGVAVHQAFPEEEANGVLITQNIADPAVMGFYINVQLGEASVTNPEDGNLPEVFSIMQRGGGIEIIRQRYSSLSPEKPILSEDEVEILYKAAQTVQNRFSILYGENPWDMALELEFKIDDPNRQLYVKQVRPYFER
ncbi:MAG: hypothetical protein GY749_41720 [Desulfobacteraceae bacterium]|nr:hypothetical protein [Desulfobacteraceae bacterium]